MRSDDTDIIPKLREYKSVPYKGGKEPRLSHGGKVVKTRVGIHHGKVGNPWGLILEILHDFR